MVPINQFGRHTGRKNPVEDLHSIVESATQRIRVDRIDANLKYVLEHMRVTDWYGVTALILFDRHHKGWPYHLISVAKDEQTAHSAIRVLEDRGYKRAYTPGISVYGDSALGIAGVHYHFTRDFRVVAQKERKLDGALFVPMENLVIGNGSLTTIPNHIFVTCVRTCAQYIHSLPISSSSTSP
ncbi:hypothetical protein HYX02_06615 [Candidatus Woesearchaeota archaeon]|nr:hypothetical protein [Candidatus Woesearchaeota archaeon]